MSQKFALLVGCSKYEDPNLARLISPASDVHLLSQLLKDPEIGGFDSVIEALDESEAYVRRSVASLCSNKKPDALLLLYFSAHGLLDENGRLHLAARDTQRDLLKATAISSSFIADELDSSGVRRKVLILDCCHSGAFARGTKGMLGASVDTASAFKGNGSGKVVLTATDSTQYAWDGENVIEENHSSASVFTRHLVEGLRTGAADENEDGEITLDEIFNYVHEKVVNTSRQTPLKWVYGQQGPIVIARSPSSRRKLATLPDHLQRALESDFPSARGGAIRDLERLLDGPSISLSRAAEQALERMSTEDDSRKLQKLAAEALSNFHKSRGERTKIVPLSEVISKFKPGNEIGHHPQKDIQAPKVKDTPGTLFVPPMSEPTLAIPAPIRDEPPSSFSLPENRRLLPGAKVLAPLVILFLLTTLSFLAINYITPKTETPPPSRNTLAEAQAISYASEVCPGCLQLGDLKTGHLQESIAVGAKESFVLKADSTYVAVAACSPEPCDLDLYLIGSNRSDTQVGPQASLQITPSLGGTIDIGVEMHQCGTGECSYALGIWTHKKIL